MVAVGPGGIACWDPLVEIITSVDATANTYCSWGGFRSPIGGELCEAVRNATAGAGWTGRTCGSCGHCQRESRVGCATSARRYTERVEHEGMSHARKRTGAQTLTQGSATPRIRAIPCIAFHHPCDKTHVPATGRNAGEQVNFFSAFRITWDELGCLNLPMAEQLRAEMGNGVSPHF
jgi:hypothetical protein